jgi:SAM-dependent methyltransferase
LSCGVLEHVADEAGSVREIARVLKPGGHFFVYQLPNWLSAVEWLSEKLVGVAHERRYRLREVRDLLSGAGFSVQKARHGSMIPKNLDRLPMLRRLFDAHPRFVLTLDGALLRVPVLNLFSGTWEIVAQRVGAPVATERLSSEEPPDLAAALVSGYDTRRD